MIHIQARFFNLFSDPENFMSVHQRFPAVSRNEDVSKMFNIHQKWSGSPLIMSKLARYTIVAYSAQNEYCPTFHFPSASPSAGVTSQLFTSYLMT